MAIERDNKTNGENIIAKSLENYLSVKKGCVKFYIITQFWMVV